MDLATITARARQLAAIPRRLAHIEQLLVIDEEALSRIEALEAGQKAHDRAIAALAVAKARPARTAAQRNAPRKIAAKPKAKP